MKYSNKIYSDGIVSRIKNKRIEVVEVNDNVLISICWTEVATKNSDPNKVRMGLERHVQHLYLKHQTAFIIQNNLNELFKKPL